jgi:hypothetical protein
MRLIISIVVMAVMLAVANKKGFNPWLWFLAAGLPGFIILLYGPSVKAQGLMRSSGRKGVAELTQSMGC